VTRQANLISILETALEPIHFAIENESHKHSVKPGSETHFRLELVSPRFEGKNRVARHRLVMELVKPELDAGLHALTMTLLAPSEWAPGMQTLASPPCLGGSKKPSSSVG
jgi:BolA protein